MTIEWDDGSIEAGQQQMLPPAASTKGRSLVGDVSFQMVALELENLRLTRLVAELLLKNQQLREKMQLV